MDRTISVSYQQKFFKLILAFRENRYCADCNSLNPDWASTTLGIFICYKCSGIHRSFGMHITRVKSTTLDTWTLKQIYVMGFIDNKQSNDFWEARLPQDFLKPNCDSAPNDLASFARKKYIERAFVDLGRESPAETIQSDLIVTASKWEDKEELFGNKLEELKKALKDKVSIMSPEKKNRDKNSPPKGRSLKKAGTIVLQRVPDNNFGLKPNLFASPGKIKPIASPLPTVGEPSKFRRNPFRFETQIASHNAISTPDHLPLFKGLNVKTINNLDEGNNEESPEPNHTLKLFFKSNTQEMKPWRKSQTRNNIEPSPILSKNNLMTIASKHKIIDCLEEEEIFEDIKGPTPKCSLDEIELQEISSIASSKKNKEQLLLDNNMKEEATEAEIEIEAYGSTKSRKSHDAKLSDILNNEPHLKRPSEAFEIPKCLSLPELPSARLRKGDLIWRYPVIVVCCLLHLTIGYIYSWGSIAPYIASFVMSDYQDDRYIEHTSHNMMIFLGLALGISLYEKITNGLGMRKSVFLGFLGLGGSILICSLTQDILLYSGLLTIVSGFFVGLLYEIPFYCASQYFYSHQSFLKGAFYLANGLGACGYIYFSYYYLSLGDINGELDFPPKSTLSLYSLNIVNNLPNLLNTIGISILIIGLLTSICLHPRSSFIIKDCSMFKERKESLLTISRHSSMRGRIRRKATALIHQGLKEALVSPSTKSLLCITVCYSMLGSYLLCSYKYLGLLHNFSDAFMSLIGGAGMILLVIGKVLGVVIHPKFEFKKMCKKTISCQIIAGLTLFALSQVYDEAFLILFLFIMFFDGLMFSLVIEETKFVHLEDIEDHMTALMITGYAVANFLSFIIVKPLILLELRSAIILILTLPLVLAYKLSGGYSRACNGEDSEMIANLLSVSHMSL